MKLVKTILFIFLSLLAKGVSGQAMHPFTVTRTGINHTIFIKETAVLSVNGEPLQNGDVIGVFYDKDGVLTCGGYTTWNGESTFITAYGDDQTGQDNGFVSGEQFKYRIWLVETGCVTQDVEVVYNTGGIILNTDEFAADGISEIGTIEAISYLSEVDLYAWANDATCRTGGKIEVAGYNDYNDFNLRAIRFPSGDVFEGVTALTELPEGTYRLRVSHGDYCTIEWQGEFVIARDPSCDSPVISPNADGVAEDYYIPYHGTAKVYDRFGVLMVEFSIPGTWDATDQNHNPLPMGTYVIICDGQKDILITVVR